MNDKKEKMLNILNFLTSSNGAENMWNAKRRENIRFLNLCEMINDTKVENMLYSLLSKEISLHWENFLS